jgi:hypothetical protein
MRVLAALFAFGWIVLPGFGAIDLTVTWSDDWPQVLEAGWGLYFTVLVGAPFVLAAARPTASPPVVGQLTAATVVLAVSAVAAKESGTLVLATALALETAVIAGLARHERTARAVTGIVSFPLVALGAAGVVPWLVYALDMWSLNRDELVDADVTNGIDHYSVQGALGLALALLPVLAAARRVLRPLVPVFVGVASAYLGLVSFAWQDAEGGFGRGWSAAAMAWGLALVLVSLREQIAGRRA